MVKKHGEREAACQNASEMLLEGLGAMPRRLWGMSRSCWKSLLVYVSDVERSNRRPFGNERILKIAKFVKDRSSLAYRRGGC